MEPRRERLFNRLLSVSVLISLLDKLMKEMVFNNLRDKTISYLTELSLKMLKDNLITAQSPPTLSL